MIGTTLSQFRITAKLGEGGMGEVYRAEDTKLGREVAIKVLPEAVADDPERLERFEREAQSIATLNHPNIVTLYSVEQAEGIHFLTMELVEGKSLDRLVPPSGIEVDRLFPLAIQIADALATAHDKGITHRDLKPANVMVTEEGRVKILDFGLAKLAEPEAEDAPTQLLTQDGMILGTVPYMSPEQVQAKPVDHRSDIFSLGILLYEMATGERPFQGDNSASVISSVLKDQPPSVTERNADLPNHLSRIVRRCLEKLPQRRFQSAREVQLELEGLEKELALAGTASGVTRTPEQEKTDSSPRKTTRPDKTKRRLVSPRIAALIGAGGLLLGALLAWTNLRPSETVPTTAGLRQFDLVLDPPPSYWEMALSADGRTLVYTGSGPGGDRVLYVRELDDFESRAIPGTDGGVVPFFSPDHQQIGFFSAGRLKRVSLLGGLPVILCSTSGTVSGALWTTEDEIVYSTGTTRVPHRVSATDGGEGQPVAVQDLDSGAIIEAPRLLSGAPGKILMTVNAPSLNGPHIGVLDLEDGQWKTIVRGLDARLLPSGALLFTQEDRLVVAPFDTSKLELSGPERAVPLAPIAVWFDDRTPRAHSTIADDGTLIYPTGAFGESRLFRLDRNGQIEPLGLAGQDAAVGISGRRLAISSAAEIFVIELETGESTRLLPSALAWYPQWSAGDTRVVYSDVREGRRGVFEVALDGGEVRELLTLEEASVATSIGPDGTIMGYQIHPVTNRDIWTLSPDGVLTMVLDSRHNERAGEISRDGTRFAYVSDEEGVDEVYIRQLPDSGRRWRVSSDGGIGPVWSRDGTELIFRQGDSIMAARVTGSGSALQIGQPKEIFTSDRIHLDRFGNPTFDTAPDGSIVIPLMEPSQVRSRVVLNWQP